MFVYIRKIGPAVLLLGIFVAFTMKTARPASPPANSEVKIDNFTFNAPTLTVPVGAEVTWTNRDDIPHTVTSEDGVFRSKALDTDEKFSYKFEKAGTYHYFCSIHPKMTAEVVVK